MGGTEEGQLIGHQSVVSLALPSSGSSRQAPWGSLPLSIQKVCDQGQPYTRGYMVFPGQSDWLRVSTGSHGGQGRPKPVMLEKALLPHHLKLHGSESWGWGCHFVTGGAMGMEPEQKKGWLWDGDKESEAEGAGGRV